MFTVNCAHLDHKIHSLAFALKERFHININKDKLDKLNLPVGPWLRRFKQALWEGAWMKMRILKLYVKILTGVYGKNSPSVS